MTNFDQSKYINEFMKEKYDRCIFNVPKGKKEEIKAHALSHGFKSMNEYINFLIDEDMRAKG